VQIQLKFFHQVQKFFFSKGEREVNVTRSCGYQRSDSSMFSSKSSAANTLERELSFQIKAGIILERRKNESGSRNKKSKKYKIEPNQNNNQTQASHHQTDLQRIIL
jgi:hypothetical protein